MKRVIAFLFLLLACCGDIASANTITPTSNLIDLTCGDLCPIEVGFQSWQVNGNPIPPADVVCNIMTGIATGVGGGTCAATPAACNGSTDDGSGGTGAFMAFNAFARTWQMSHVGKIELLMPPGANCVFKTGGNADNGFTFGLKDLLIVGYGATLAAEDGATYVLGTATGICPIAIPIDSTACSNFVGSAASARIATVSAGATSVTVLDTSLCSLFVTGRYVVTTGFALFGAWESQQGFPPDPQYFEFVKIASTSSCATTGQIDFETPLINTYLSTWPVFSAGGASAPDQGGPATIYPLDPEWDLVHEYLGLTINQPDQNAPAIGRVITWRDVTFEGASCTYPTQNYLWSAINVTIPFCSPEVDKLIDTIVVDRSNLAGLSIQSPHPRQLTITHSTLGTLAGTPYITNISDTTITTGVAFGPLFYGVSSSVTCTNCVLPNPIMGGFVEKGDNNDLGVNVDYSMSGGVISYPSGTAISAVAQNGTTTRATVASSAGWAVGQSVDEEGACTGQNGQTDITGIPDGTHIDIARLWASCGSSTGTGSIGGRAPRWAPPGTRAFWVGTFDTVGSFTIGTVTQGGPPSNNVSVSTNRSGGFPPGIGAIQTHPAPSFTCTNCTGSSGALSLSMAPPGAPLWSYANFTYTPLNNIDASQRIWGIPVTIKFTVTVPYTGPTSGVTFKPVLVCQVGSTGVTHQYQPIIDLTIAHTVTVTTSSVTGTQGGDSVPSYPDPHCWLAGWDRVTTTIITPDVSSQCSGSVCPNGPSITLEVVTDQSLNYLLKRDLDPASNDNSPVGLDQAA